MCVHGSLNRCHYCLLVHFLRFGFQLLHISFSLQSSFSWEQMLRPIEQDQSPKKLLKYFVIELLPFIAFHFVSSLVFLLNSSLFLHTKSSKVLEFNLVLKIQVAANSRV